MKKSLYRRLLIACTVLLLLLLTGLGLVLGQFFPLFGEHANPELQKSYIGFLILILLIAFILSFLMAARMMVQYAKPIDDATETALRVAGGDYVISMPTNEHNPELELTVAIKKIANTMQEMSVTKMMEKERLNTLVESMGSALLMIGREGAINLVNGVFRETFGFTSEKIVGKTFNDIGLPVEIESLIENVFMTEQANDKQVRLRGGVTPSYVNVYGAPVIGHHGNWLGIVVVMHDITKLRLLEEVRKNFVANVSHELRTPITSITGFTETLLAGAMEEPEVLKEFLEIIQKEGNRLQLLVDDLLALSGMETDAFSLELAPVNLRSVINDALKIVSGNMAQKKMNIFLDITNEVIIQGDADRLIQVMVNLLSNAITYSKDNKTITISVTESTNRVSLEVKDEGIGIAPLELSRLFERFYRVDRARSRDSGGTGLGLAIVKHLVEAHGGTVNVESILGEGTTFKVHLPIER